MVAQAPNARPTQGRAEAGSSCAPIVQRPVSGTRAPALKLPPGQAPQDRAATQRLVLPARRLADDGLKVWLEVLARGYEGLVAKDPTAPYVGGRTLKWLKVKQPKYRDGERGWAPKGKFPTR